MRAMPWLGSLPSAKNASPAATQRITEKNRVNSLNRRSHAGSRAILSTRLGPNSRSRRRASSEDSPSGLLRSLRSASSTESWWIFIGCPNPEHMGFALLVALQSSDKNQLGSRSKYAYEEKI